MSPSSHKADEAKHSKMAKSNAPEKHTLAVAPGDAPAEKVAGKRQRRPSVRLGEIGGYQSSDSNRKVVSKSNGKQAPIAKKSEGYETLGGGEKEGKLESGRSKKSFTKRVRSDLVNDKFVKDGEFGATDSESESGNLEIEKPVKTEIGRSKRTRTDRRVSVEDKISAGKDEGGFRVSDSESPENLEIENGGDHGGRKGDEPSEDGDGERNVGVKAWLDQMGLGKYGKIFHVHEVDQEVLPLLTLEDLKDMGINAVGSRRKIYACIQKLRD